MGRSKNRRRNKIHEQGMRNRPRQFFSTVPNGSVSKELLNRVHNRYVDILKRLDPIPLREICDSPSLAGVVVRLHVVILDFHSTLDISHFLFNHLEIAGTAELLQEKVKLLIAYVRLVSLIHATPLSSTPISRDSIKDGVSRTGEMFGTVFNFVYLQIQKRDVLYMYLEIMHKLRQEYLCGGHSITLAGDSNQHILAKGQENSLLRRPDTTPENIVDRVIEDLGSLNNDERMELNKFEPYFDVILEDVETCTEFQFLTLFLNRLENSQIHLRTKLMVGFICILSWKRFKLLDGLNKYERREILFNFKDIVFKHIGMTLPETFGLYRLGRVKEIYTESCILPKDLFDDVNFDPIREITRTTAGTGYSSQRKCENGVDLMNQDPKAGLIKAFSTNKVTGQRGLVVINQLVDKFASHHTSAPGFFKLFFQDATKLNNDCKKALLWALDKILRKFAIVDFDKTHGSDLKRLLDSFEVTGSEIRLDALEFLALKSRLSKYLHEDMLSGIDTTVSRIFKIQN